MLQYGYLRGFLCIIGIALIVDIVFTYGIFKTALLLAVWIWWYNLRKREVD